MYLIICIFIRDIYRYSVQDKTRLPNEKGRKNGDPFCFFFRDDTKKWKRKDFITRLSFHILACMYVQSKERNKKMLDFFFCF